SAVDGGATTTYSINALGQRNRKNGPNGDSRYIYSPDGLMLSENANGQYVGHNESFQQVVQLSGMSRSCFISMYAYMNQCPEM
ncbi:MAG: hypothetical protein RIQ43_1105, partial [Pseudomonadota bacterium]